MSRVSPGDTIVMKPKMNVYTALAFVATVAVVLALVVMHFRSQTLFAKSLFDL